MLGKLVVGVVIVMLVMAAVKNGTILRRAGLLSSCSITAASTPGYRWEFCSAGRLDGRPDLTSSGCTSESVHGGLETWYCAVSTASGPEGL
jgi:hypothetical protein